MKQSTKTSISIIVLVIVAAGSFFIGTAYGKKHATTNRMAANFMNSQRGSFGMGSRTAAGGTVAGTILSKDDTSITVKLTNGGSRIVLLSPTTPVLKSTTGTSADLKVGEQVFAGGTANADGSITAQSITIGSLMGFGGRMQVQAPKQ